MPGSEPTCGPSIHHLDTSVILRTVRGYSDAAGAIGPHVKSLDAIHLVSAIRIGIGTVIMVTHSGNMLRTAVELGDHGS